VLLCWKQLRPLAPPNVRSGNGALNPNLLEMAAWLVRLNPVHQLLYSEPHMPSTSCSLPFSLPLLQCPHSTSVFSARDIAPFCMARSVYL